jgi:Glycosyl hydrolase family 30 beta sandwich domain
MNIRTTCFASGLSVLLLTFGVTAQETITVDSSVTYQTMRGWEVTDYIADPCDPAFPALRDAIIPLAVDDIGINRVRLEVRSGVENTQDYYGDWVANGCPEPPAANYVTWRENRYATVNDNGDPNTINPNGFHFTELDWNVENIILPLKQRVEAGGETLHINLNYVAFTGQIVGGSYEHNDPAEYAEFVLATYQHLQNDYGIVPDTWELVLEPDNVSQWDGTLLGQAIVSTAALLTANGFTPAFVGPSNTNMANAITYFDDMIAVPGALEHLEEISYHRYGGVSIPNLESIADRAVVNNLSTGMLEWWFDNGTFEVLHEDLTVGRNSAWQGSVLAGLFNIDASNPLSPIITYRTNTKFNRQYFKFVRHGAVRIDASSDGSTFEPIAFINEDGRYVVVTKAGAGGSFIVSGIPAGTYGLKYTTNAEYDVDLPNVTIADGETVGAAIPESGVMTIYAIDSGTPMPVPTVSEWSLIVMWLLSLTAATAIWTRRKAAAS